MLHANISEALVRCDDVECVVPMDVFECCRLTLDIIVEGGGAALLRPLRPLTMREGAVRPPAAPSEAFFASCLARCCRNAA